RLSPASRHRQGTDSPDAGGVWTTDFTAVARGARGGKLLPAHRFYSPSAGVDAAKRAIHQVRTSAVHQSTHSRQYTLSLKAGITEIREGGSWDAWAKKMGAE